MELLHARRRVEHGGLVELVATIVAHLWVALAFEAHSDSAFLHIRVGSDASWLLVPVMNLGLLHLYLLLRVGMDLVDVRLHHLVLLLYYGASWKSCTLVTLLPGLPDAFESRILGAHVVLEGVHLLSGACHSVSHLELRMGKLLAFASLVWLRFRIDLETLVGVILLLAGWSAGQGRRGPVP